MDIMEELGALSLGSRLKRLSDTLMQDGVRIYQVAGMGFEPRWFPVFVYLYRKGPTSITELAKGLGVSHPGINKIANEMIEARLAAPYKDRNDKRKRVLALTSTGREKYLEMEPVWRDIRQALQGIVDECGGEFLSQLTKLERCIDRSGFHERYLTQISKPDVSVRVVDFHPRYAPDFESLNRAWIEHYFTLEEADTRVLVRPKEKIVDSGGQILFAIDEVSDAVIGTCAIVRLSDETAELAKMAVAEEAKGRHIGAVLGEAAIERSRQMGFQQLVLESNRKLHPAISLYRRLGFSEKPFPHESDYKRADIYMELTL